jgi:hypothetical protein
MGLFPDEFPFTKRQDDQPVVEATPLAPASVFPDDFPFNGRRETRSEPAAASEPQPSSVFPPGFPFNHAQPEPQAEATVATPTVPAEEAYDEPEAVALAAPLPFKERRRSPRQRMRAKATLRVDNIGGNPINVELENLSLLGVRFRADRSLLLNDKANIRLEIGPLKWNARLRVINCLPGADGATFTIGCEFVGNELARGRAAA